MFGEEIVTLRDLAVTIDVKGGVWDAFPIPCLFQVIHRLACRKSARFGPTSWHLLLTRYGVKSAALQLLGRIDLVA